MDKKKSFFLAAVLISTLAIAADPKEIADYKDAYTLYTSGQYDKTLEKLNAFEHDYPQGAELAQAENLHGLSYLLLRQPLLAVPHLKRAIELSPGGKNFVQYVRYNLAKAQFESNQLDDSLKTLLDIQADLMDSENQLKFHFLKARVYSKRGLPLETARECLVASRLLNNGSAEAKEARAPLVQLLEQSLQEMNNLPQVESLSSEFPDSPVLDTVYFHLGSREISGGARDNGSTHLRSLMSSFPQSVYYAKSAELLKSLQDQTTVDSSAIGVLLPISGKFGKIGTRNLQAIELAFEIFNPDKPDSKINLIIEDSGEDPEQTIQALDRLTTKHHVLAVIGPLLSKGVEQITQHAQDLGVPLISLSRHQGIAGDSIFQAGITLRNQTQQIAKFAVEDLKFKKFAVLYPKDKVGEEASQDFWNAAEGLGGEIRGIENYSASETDFRQQVDKLSGLYYTEARKDELEDLAKQREENHIKKRTRKTEQYFGLKPIVDYEAVFVPDDSKISGQILPTFAYRDVDQVKFLGTSAWDSTDLVLRAGSVVDNAFFVDAFSPDLDDPSSQRFVERFKTTYNTDAPSSMEAVAYDAAKVLEFALHDGNPKNLSRADIRDRLRAVKNFSGVTGKISVTDGTFSRDLKVFTFKNGKVILSKK